TPGTADAECGSAAGTGSRTGARSGGWTKSAAGTARGAHGAGFHDHNHGFDFARGEQVVEDPVGSAHFDPDPLIFAPTVLQIQYRVARGRVDLISGWRIDEDVPPGIR